jgi:hypothetical protein
VTSTGAVLRRQVRVVGGVGGYGGHGRGLRGSDGGVVCVYLVPTTFQRSRRRRVARAADPGGLFARSPGAHVGHPAHGRGPAPGQVPQEHAALHKGALLPLSLLSLSLSLSLLLLSLYAIFVTALHCTQDLALVGADYGKKARGAQPSPWAAAEWWCGREGELDCEQALLPLPMHIQFRSLIW